MKDVVVALWLWHRAECFLKPCMKKTVFTGDERPTDRIQTSLSFALQCAPCAGATRVETLAIQYKVAAAATDSDFIINRISAGCVDASRVCHKVGKSICNHAYLILCKINFCI